MHIGKNLIYIYIDKMNVLRILSGITLVVDIVIIIFFYVVAIIFDDFENEFNKKLFKIMIITGIISLILLVFLPGIIF